LRYFFFFQAEDGIRDLYVTGVQTCALPIYSVISEWGAQAAWRWSSARCLGNGIPPSSVVDNPGKAQSSQGRNTSLVISWCREREIGRASCRETVWTRVVTRCWMK